jgi:hypothetical protein
MDFAKVKRYWYSNNQSNAPNAILMMFLDLKKVYDTLDRIRTLAILKGYGVRTQKTLQWCQSKQAFLVALLMHAMVYGTVT